MFSVGNQWLDAQLALSAEGCILCCVEQKKHFDVQAPQLVVCRCLREKNLVVHTQQNRFKQCRESSNNFGWYA